MRRLKESSNRGKRLCVGFSAEGKTWPDSWQFPAQFRFDAEKSRVSFKLLPRDTNRPPACWSTRKWLKAASDEARSKANRSIRHAVEIPA